MDDWTENRKLVLSEIKRLNDSVEKLNTTVVEFHQNTSNEITALKIRDQTTQGFISTAVSAVVSVVINYIFHRPS